MVLLIDGHNLIPHIPGISLGDPDDEGELIKLLQEYCRLRRRRIEVFFDRAPAGLVGTRSYGLVKAHFAGAGRTADDAIMDWLKKLGRQARNVAVVSSDRQVIQAARAVHAAVITSDEFAAEWQKLAENEPAFDLRNRLLTEEELTLWEDLFRRGKPSSGDESQPPK